MKKTIVIAGLVIVFALIIEANAVQSQATQQQATTTQQTTTQQPSTQQVAPKVKVGPALTAKANSPAPSATAQNPTKKASIGKGKVSVKASQPSSFWAEQIDVEGNGTVVSTDLLYDAQRGILYAYREGDFTCQNGQPGSGSILEAVYTKGNKAGKPVGSGAYVVELDEGKCGAKAAGEYGCKFDASGNATECGVATINDATGEVDVVVAQ